MTIFTSARFLLIALLLWNAVSLSSCTVYAPMQPVISTVSKAGQVEATAGIQLNGRLEGSAVYAPLPHLLLTAGGTYRPSFGDRSGYFFRTQQWEAGLGSYLPLTERLQLTGMLGYGQALSERAEYDPIFDNTSSVDETSYQKVFGQAGLSYLRSRYAFGCVYRYTHVRFDYLHEVHYDRIDLVDIGHSHRHEALGYARCGFRFLPPKWQIQFSVGLSSPLNLRRISSDDDPTGGIKRFERPALLLGAGLVFGSKR